jgi:hypothetical protein
MKLQAIHGKILELTKNVHLQSPTGVRAYKEQFLAQGIGMTWWTTDQSRRAERMLANATMKSNPRLTNGDVKTFGTALSGVLKNRLFNTAFFSITLPLGGTLFDAISVRDKAAFSAQIWNEMITACDNTVGNWLTIYPLRKVAINGSSQNFGNLKVIATGDAASWSALQLKFPSVVQFNPQLGQFSPNGYGFRGSSNVWLIAEHKGTAAGAQRRAAREMSAFIALAFAFSLSRKPGVILKSGAEPETYSLQLSDAKVGTVCFGSIGELFPPLLNSLDLDATLMTELGAWYKKRDRATEEKAARASTAAAFLHHAVIADDIERFIHTFIVVDALFGERGKVEAKILEGIAKVFPGDLSWEHRTKLLFDLRSEIVHGVVSDLEDWSGDDDYHMNFRVEPTQDASVMATTALRGYFDMP